MNARAHLFAILLLAAVLRLYGLGAESFWLDEGTTVKLTSLPYLRLAENGTQGPLFLFVAKVMRDLFGLSEFVLRFLPAVFGAVCVLAGYHLGKRLFSETAGLLAALLLAVNPFLIHYSQDARPYTLFLLGALGALYFTLQFAARRRWCDVAGCALTTNVALYSHPFGVFLFPACAAAFFLTLREQPRDSRATHGRRVGVAALCAVLISFPQLIRYGESFFGKTGGEEVATWIARTGLCDLAFTWYHYFAWPWLGLLVLTVIIAALVWRRPSRTEWTGLAIAAAVGLFCTILPWAISLRIAPIYQPRYGIPGLAMAVLIFAWALTVFPRKIRIALLAAVFVLTLVPLFSYYTKVDKDPWRQTAERLRALVVSRDTVIEFPGWTNEPLNFYFRPDSSIRVLNPPDDSDLRPLIRGTGRIWLVSSYPSRSGERERLLFAALAESHLADSLIRVTGGLNRNPWAVHVAEITIIRFRPKVAP